MKPGARRLLVGLGFVAALLVAALVFGRSLRAELSVSGVRFAAGEPVRFELSVCSNSVLRLNTDDGKPRWEILDESGDPVADSSHYVFTLELKTLWWSPRECRTVIAETWGQREWNQAVPRQTAPGRPERGKPVPPGRYLVRAGWAGLPIQEAAIEITDERRGQ